MYKVTIEKINNKNIIKENTKDFHRLINARKYADKCSLIYLQGLLKDFDITNIKFSLEKGINYSFKIENEEVNITIWEI